MAQDVIQDTKLNDARTDMLNWLHEVREARKKLEGTGHYILLPTDELTFKAEAYFSLFFEDVSNLLDASGLDEQTRDTILQDYVKLLWGFYNVGLPLTKQVEVVKAVRPYKLFLTERYGLSLLFSIYRGNIRAAGDYLTNFKDADGHIVRVTKHRENGKEWEERENLIISVEEQKTEFLRTRLNRIISGTAPSFAAAYYWINRNKTGHDGELFDIVELSDFVGVEPELTNKYLAYCEAYAGISDYVNYYYLAKYALKATADELKEIEYPPLFEDAERAQEYAERLSTQRYRKILSTAAEVDKAINADTEKEREQARQEVTSEPTDTEETIRIPENIALLGSRDVYASTNGEDIIEKGVIPISKVIAIYEQRRKDLPVNVTPYTVDKAIQGLNMLQRFNHNAPVGGWFTYETNITEFSRLCGYEIANAEEKAALMHSLMILRDLYVIVWKPKGRVAIQLLTVPEIGVSGELKGQFKLQVNAEALKGHQNFITLNQYDAIRKQAKGQAQAHFNAQILAKGRREENALLNEVFGYDTMLLEATGNTGDERVNPEAVRNVKEFIRKNKPNHRKKIAKWFEEYQSNGFLESYNRTKNARGEYIYTWRRANIPKEQGLTPQEPDEQGTA